MTAHSVTTVEDHEGSPPAHYEPQDQSTALVSMIERMVLNPEVDVDKLERLIRIQREIMAERAAAEFADALRSAQAEMPQVVRDAENSHTKSLYAKYETISEAIQPIITKHGFGLSFGEDDSPKENCIRIVCDVSHVGGHTKRYHGDIPIDSAGAKGTSNKSPTQAYGSTKTYGRRYLKCDIFDVAVKNQDTDGNVSKPPETISEDQIAKLERLLTETQSDKAKFLAIGKLAALDQMLAADFDGAVRMLEQKRSKTAAPERS